MTDQTTAATTQDTPAPVVGMGTLIPYGSVLYEVTKITAQRFYVTEKARVQHPRVGISSNNPSPTFDRNGYYFPKVRRYGRGDSLFTVPDAATWEKAVDAVNAHTPTIKAAQEALDAARRAQADAGKAFLVAATTAS